MSLKIQSSIQTDAGRSAEVNEDWCGTSLPSNPDTASGACWLWVIADGVGSYGTGQEASSHAGPALCRAFDESPELSMPDRLRSSFHAANRALWELRRAYVQQGSDRPVLTTGLAAAIQGHTLWVANVGDCRAYLVRAGQPNQLTVDHTKVQDLVRLGQLTPQQARTHPESHVLSRSLGDKRTVEVDVFECELAPADTVVLCSDGVTRYLTDEEIAHVALQGAAESATQTLIEIANARGGADNLTAAVIRLEVAPTPPDFSTLTRETAPLGDSDLAGSTLSSRSVGADRQETLAFGAVMRMISGGLDVEATLVTAIDAIVQITGGQRGYIMQWDQQLGRLRFSVGRNIKPDGERAPAFSRHIVEEVFERGEPILLNDAQAVEKYRAYESIVIEDVRSLMCVPLERRGQRSGVVYVESQLAAGVFSQADLELLHTFADHAAVVLENARLYSELRSQMDELAVMRANQENVLRGIRSAIISTDLSGTLQLANRAAEQLLGFSSEQARGKPFGDFLPRALRRTLSAFAAGLGENDVDGNELQIDAELPGRGRVKLGVRGFSQIDAGNRAVGSILLIDDLNQERLLSEAWQRAATERERVKSIFGRFLAPSIVAQLGDREDALKLGGARREITVMFADLRGFTTLSEHRSPEDVVTLLNSYLACATDAILEHGGMLDKFLGDGVLALFNAPMDQENHALSAVRTAVAIQSRLQAFAPASGPRLSCGVGLATGDAVVGTIGTQEIMNYTAIGDVVNLASRLQSEARPGEVLLADSTYQQVIDMVDVDELGPIHVKGRSDPVSVFKVRSLRDA